MQRWYKHGRSLLDEITHSTPQKGEAHVWFAGQHGFIVNIVGKVFYFDVILNDIMGKDGISRRTYPPPFCPEEIQRVDYLICSHNHGDHLNLKTLLPLAKTNPEALFVVPAPHKKILLQAGIDEDRILAARVGEDIKINAEITLIPLPAVHTSYVQDEGEKDENGNYTALGFILKGEGISLYHAGDTWVTPGLVSALKEHAPLDLAMLPINGTDWERTAENCIGNVSYLDAVKLARAVPIDLVIPSHYDMMANNSENPAKFADAMYRLCPEKRFHISALGERFIYRK